MNSRGESASSARRVPSREGSGREGYIAAKLRCPDRAPATLPGFPTQMVHGGRGLAVHLAVGALIGTSALFKYQGLTFLGASIGMLAWTVFLGRASRAWAVS